MTGGLEQRALRHPRSGQARRGERHWPTDRGVLPANNLTVPSGQIPADGTSVPVSTIGTFTSIEQIADLVVGPGADAGPRHAAAAPAGGATAPGRAAPASAASQPATPPPAAMPRPAAAPRRSSSRSRSASSAPRSNRRHGFGRTNGEPALTLTVSKTSDANTVDGGRRRPGEAGRDRARHADQLTITTVADLSVFIKESANGLLREGGLGRALRDPDDLPVPVQPARDGRRGGQHPALDPGRARRSCS